MTEYVTGIDLHQFAEKWNLPNGEDTWQQELNFGRPQYIEIIIVVLIQPHWKDFISMAAI